MPRCGLLIGNLAPSREKFSAPGGDCGRLQNPWGGLCCPGALQEKRWRQGEGCLYFWRLCVNDDGRKATLRQERNSGVAIDSTSLAMLPNVPELEADPLSDQRKCPIARRASSVEWYTCHGSPCVTQGSSDCAFLLLFAPDFASLAGAARPDGSWCWLQF